MKERIFSLRLDVKDSDLPFAIKHSICVESGSLTKVLALFPSELNRLLKELKSEEDLDDDDIPF